MKGLQDTVLNLSQKIDTVDPLVVNSTFEKYSQIPEGFRDIDKLRNFLRDKYPVLFSRDIQFKDKIMNKEKQEDIKQQILTEDAKTISRFKSLDKVNKYLEMGRDEATKVKNDIEDLFAEDDCQISFRFKEPKSIYQNVEWGNAYTLVDVIRLRIVPKVGKFFPSLLKKIEENLGIKLAFKLNIFSYSIEEITKKISKNSIYYRAVHYHFKDEQFFTEIQIRPPATNQWANLSHGTLYKTKIKIDKKTKKYIMDFGRIANIVDYFEMLDQD